MAVVIKCVVITKENRFFDLTTNHRYMDISWRFKRQNGVCQPHRWFWSIDVIFTHSIVSEWYKLTLHMAAAPAVLEAIKSELSYRNDMMITFSSQLTKLKTELKLVCPLLILNYRIPGLISWGKAFFLENKITIILPDDTRRATRELPCRTPATHFWCQIRFLEAQNISYFSLFSIW